jgi:hypothetical protein
VRACKEITCALTEKNARSPQNSSLSHDFDSSISHSCYIFIFKLERNRTSSHSAARKKFRSPNTARGGGDTNLRPSSSAAMTNSTGQKHNLLEPFDIQRN